MNRRKGDYDNILHAAGITLFVVIVGVIAITALVW